VGFAQAQLPVLRAHLQLAEGLPRTSSLITGNDVLSSRNTGIGQNNTSIGTFSTGTPIQNLFGEGPSRYGYGSAGNTAVWAPRNTSYGSGSIYRWDAPASTVNFRTIGN
jgi:hypothetical protein